MAGNKYQKPDRLNWRELLNFGLTMLFILCLASSGFEPSFETSKPVRAPVTTPVAANAGYGSQAATASPITAQPNATQPPFTPTLNNSTATAASSPDWSRNWLEENPCAPPCWEGITPGVTTFDQTLQILRKLKFVRSLATDNYASIKIRWNFAGPDSRYTENTIYFDEQKKVTVMFLTFPGFKGKDVLERFGEPDYVWAQRNIPNSLTLLLLKRGISITLTSNKDPVLNENSLFTIVGFTSPGSLNDYQMNTQYPYSLAGLPPWQGYKNFDFYLNYWNH